VLAAEEFAFPAPEDRAGLAERSGSLPWVAALGGLLVGVLAALRGRGRRSRRRRRSR
jgi:membrane associated rhomboid family serine protease